MQQSNRNIFYYVILGLVIAATIGCSDDDSSVSGDDKWFAAGNLEQAYKAEIQMEALNAGKKPFEADTSCMAML
ncbi:MAG: hypothetical protein V2I26_18860, partial [Halieaceae bacterium]|nr:hypothetical protein [Halieaceae bacterium]